MLVVGGTTFAGLLLAGFCVVSAGKRLSVSELAEEGAEPLESRLIADACPPGLRRVVAHGQPEVFVDVPSTPVFDGRALMRFVSRYREECRQRGVESAQAGTLSRQILGAGVTTFDDAAPALCVLLQDDDPAVRAGALTALGAFRRADNETVDGMEPENAADDECVGESSADDETGGDDAVAIEEEAPEDFRSRVTVVMMTAGLADAEPVVRDAAYETLVGLPDEERAQLSLQLLGNDDTALKQALLAETAQADDEQSLTLNFHGLDADELEVRQLAAENILAKTGQTFESSDQAYDWYEKQLPEGAGSAEEGVTSGPDPAEDQTDRGNLLPNMETEQEQPKNEN